MADKPVEQMTDAELLAALKEPQSKRRRLELQFQASHRGLTT